MKHALCFDRLAGAMRGQDCRPLANCTGLLFYASQRMFWWLVNRLTRSELIRRMAARYPRLPLAQIDTCVRAMLDHMAAQLAEGGRIEIRDFGSFSVVTRPARRGRNPLTGESVAVPAKGLPLFRPGLALRERVAAAYVSPVTAAEPYRSKAWDLSIG